jgi:hypothetical protein
LQRALADVERYDAALTKAVEEARAEGATWADIGQELDRTPQAAHHRFAKKIREAPEPDGSAAS